MMDESDCSSQFLCIFLTVCNPSKVGLKVINTLLEYGDCIFCLVTANSYLSYINMVSSLLNYF